MADVSKTAEIAQMPHNNQMQRTCQKRHAFCEAQKPRRFSHAADLGR